MLEKLHQRNFIQIGESRRVGDEETDDFFIQDRFDLDTRLITAVHISADEAWSESVGFISIDESATPYALLG